MGILYLPAWCPSLWHVQHNFKIASTTQTYLPKGKYQRLKKTRGLHFTEAPFYCVLPSHSGQKHTVPAVPRSRIAGPLTAAGDGP